MLWPALLVLCTKLVLAEKRVYEITGTATKLAGFYVETEELQVFQNLCEKDFYLFRHSKNLTEWRIGTKDKKEKYKASGGEDDPPADGWRDVRTGELTRTDWRVEKKPSLVSTLLG